MPEPKHSFLHDLFLKHAHEVSAFIRGRWPKEQDVDDIMQESFLRLSQVPNPETILNPRAFLFTTAANRVMDRRRSRKTKEHYVENVEASTDTDCHRTAGETLIHDSSAPIFSSLPKDDLNRIFLDASSQLHRFLARRVQCPETAADLTQEVYLRLPQMQASVADEVGVRAWLFRVASNLSIDHLRSQHRHAELLNQFCGNETEIDKAPSPYRAVMDRDRLNRVQNALKDLPDQCAEVLYLSRIEGYSHAEIAGQLGISKSLVEKHVMRALNHCRQAVDEEGE
ncbi:MAG: sigma-70 family RNA polymerase sigma factor [Methylobacter sp.]|jgi:RNA polymerase sigma-70 factor (ECF subfamily)|nr:sigma-70 family RNA polymerase sigma factor [Methylobacter sp.]